MSEQVLPQAGQVLIISHDVVGSSMAGPGIRCWEMARVLATQQQVTLIAPQPIDLEAGDIQLGSFAPGDVDSLAVWLHTADIVIASGYTLLFHPELAQIEQPLVLDLYDPTLLENLELYRQAPDTERITRFAEDRALLERQFAAGDFFLCATERQRDLYLGALLASGRITPAALDNDPDMRGLIDVVSYGLPDESPTKQQPALRGVIAGIGIDDPLLLWTGGLWDWMDPLTLVAAMPQIVAQQPDTRLVFLAGQHPGIAHQMRMSTSAREQAAAVGLLNTHIFFYDTWVPYAQRGDFLLEADIAISLHRAHLETRYAAVRSRILDHLWAGLPTVLSAGDAAAELLQGAGAALVVPPEQSDELAVALCHLLDDSEKRQALAQAASTLAGRMTWATVLAPLLRFCQHPRRQRVTTPASTQAAPAGTSDEVPAAPLSHDENLAECRNAAIAVQEQTWNLYEPPPAGGRLDRPRQTIINHAVRPYIVPLLDQQRAHNAAILRSMYAINQMADDHRRETQIDRQETHVHVDQLYLRVYSLEHENRVVNDQLDHINRLMNQRLDDSTRLIHHLSEHNTRLINQRSDDNTRLIHHLFEHNNRVLNHMIELISGLVEQIRGLEDTDTQLLAATRVALAAAGNAAREMETDIREATEE